MRKSTLFISAALTTFMLAVMFGVASAYQKVVQTGISTETSQQAQPAAVTSGAANVMTLEEAAALASSVIGRTDLYTAENTQLDGVDAYLVTFSSGDLVYVSLDGKVLSISKIPVQYVLGQAASQGGGGGGGDGGNSSTVAPAAPSAPSTESGDDHGDDDYSGGDDDDDD